MTAPSTRPRGQLDVVDDEFLGFSADQRSAQPNQVQKILSPGCIVVYKECQKNQALDSAIHCVDGCGEFMRRGASVICYVINIITTQISTFPN